MSSLSENIKTVVNIKDRNTGQLVMEEGILREIDFRLDHFPEGYDKEQIARTLAPLNHLQNLKSSIPDTVTFMEMYGAETFSDLQVLQKWQQNAPYKSLAVPIGLRGKEDLVYLNLHEKAHGPHGLIAGTTGSGKSETIQSYILSLAVNFHPHDVAFLLIDYKGGGMANLFKNLPHLLGTITNLDGVQSMRALASINAEIHRRERLFREFEVNHINQYQKKFKNGEATEPLPHLFLISDEFAELKVNQPDFIKELVSIARVGRSLGVHLILATQKPSGVVDDQIWSNSRFKLALKERMTLQELEPIQPQEAWEQKQPVSVLLGMADIPQAQKQEPVSVNLSKDGHILLYGSPGTGKTTFLQSAAMDLARKFSPKDVTLYLMDFGTNGLAPLGQLPQVADTLLLDQTEKIAKFVRIMERELNRRKKLLSDYGVGTLELYRQASGQEEPAIVILLDSYESMKEEAYEAELFKLLVRISREGLSIGVHLLVTAGRQSNLRAQFYANFKHQLSLPQNDVGEVRSIVGSTPLAKTMEDIKGRALMKRDEVDVIQLDLPVAGANDAQVLNNLRQEVASLQEAWTGQRPSAIPMVPEELTEAEFAQTPSVQEAVENAQIPIGLEMEMVESVSLSLNRFKHLAYLSNAEDAFDNITQHLLKVALHIMPNIHVMLIDAFQEYESYSKQVKTYVGSKKELTDIGSQLVYEVERRLENGLSSDWLIFIPNLKALVSESDISEKQLQFLFENGHRVGMRFIIGGDYTYIGTSIDAIPRYIKTNVQWVIFGMRLMDQTFLDKPYNNKEVRPEPDEIYLHSRKQVIKLKITRNY